MIIRQIYTDNAYRNFNYLIACEETGEALAVDPLAADTCLAVAEDEGWRITQVLNTHEHPDHIGGNTKVIAATGAQLLAHAGARDSIPNIDRGLIAGDSITIGKAGDLEVLDTPGHTMSHVCLLAHGAQPALISGDTLFNAGAGNCHNGGHPEDLYQTFVNQLAKLPGNTRLYPGHDYLINNLEFTLSREPGNHKAASLLSSVVAQDPHDALVTTIDLEKEINTFFRLANPEVIETLREQFPDLPANPTGMQVFIKLRELRNSW
ncbi:MAG: hydroxyacylglutathione hydrolase family protein [Gammaproteobacteria bacterium]|nr:hydroxyacylglutathione hydrolase family protein [Gammaproteobacteria bacterium]